MKNAESNFEIKEKVVASQGYPIIIGMSEPIHTVKRFGERGGVACSHLCLNDISESLKQRPEIMTLLTKLHMNIETTKKSIALKMPQGAVYILQYGGFIEYLEAFDYVTYYNEVYCGSTFKTDSNTIVVKVSESNGPIYINNMKWNMPEINVMY